MPLHYILDEHLRGTLLRAILRHNASGALPIDAVEIGEAAAPPLGVSDEMLLLWAAEHDRILVTRDRSTMPMHLAAHLVAGHHSPGVLLVGHGSIRSLVEYLAVAAHASEAAEWKDQLHSLPDDF